MSTVSCPACGHRFETTAATNTRCRRCRHVCNVGTGARSVRRKRGWFVALVLHCGHDNGYEDMSFPPDEAAGYLFACQVCGARRQGVRHVLGGLPMQRLDAMDEEQTDRFFAELARALAGATAG